MEKTIRISDLSAIFEAGVKNFAENLLKTKAEKGETVVYSIDGQIIKLQASDALWIYKKILRGLEPWEVEFLTDKASRGEDMKYWLEGSQTLAIPARLVLELFNRMKEVSDE